MEKLDHQKFFDVGTRLSNAAKEYWSLLLGAIVLELVFMFSFRSGDGLYLILPTLAVGTFVFILDGRNTSYKARNL